MTILSIFDIGLVVLILAVGAATIAMREAFSAVIGYVVYGLLGGPLIIGKHRDNIGRLRAGTENRFGRRAAGGVQ